MPPKKRDRAEKKPNISAPKPAPAPAPAPIPKDEKKEMVKASTVPAHLLVPFVSKERTASPAPAKTTTVKVGDKTVHLLEGTDLSGLRVGKARLVSKKKRKMTVLKKLILEGRAKQHADSKLVEFIPLLPEKQELSESSTQQGESSDNVHVPPDDFIIPSWMTSTPQVKISELKSLASDALSKNLPLFETPTCPLWLQQQGCDLEVRHYVHTHLSPSLDEKVSSMLRKLTDFQSRLRSENEMKFIKMKRYCIGFNEIRRAIERNKLKGLIVAPNIQESEVEGSLDDVVMNSVEKCRAKEIPIIFALSRTRLGKAVGRANSRLNVIGLLSVDGQNVEWKAICKESAELRNRWVIDQLGRSDAIE